MRPLFLTVVLLSSPLYADEKQTAKAAAREGQRLMDVGEYQAALEALKRAYVAGEDVRLLYDIAECQRLLNHKAEAIQAYRTYLRKNPNADNTAEVETWIAELSGQPKAVNLPTPVIAKPPNPPANHLAPPPQPTTIVVMDKPVMPSPAATSVYNPWGAPASRPAPTPTAPPPAPKQQEAKPAAKPKGEPKKPAPARSWTDF